MPPTTTKPKTRQIEHKGSVDQLSPETTTSLTDLIQSVNDETWPTLRITAPGSLTLYFSPSTITNSVTNRKRTTPFVGTALPSLSFGNITFPSASGGTVSITPGTNTTITITANNYRKVTFYLDTTGNLNVAYGVENTIESSATVAKPSGETLVIGYATLFNNAGTISNVTQSNIYMFPAGTITGAAGASVDLSNLSVTTLINSSLSPATNNTISLGTSLKMWLESWASTFFGNTISDISSVTAISIGLRQLVDSLGTTIQMHWGTAGKLDIYAQIRRLRYEYNSYTSSNSIAATDVIVLADCTAATVTLTLPDATLNANKGRTLTIKRTDPSVNSVIVDGFGTQTIDGSLTKTLTTQWQVIHLVNDGFNWYIV